MDYFHHNAVAGYLLFMVLLIGGLGSLAWWLLRRGQKWEG